MYSNIFLDLSLISRQVGSKMASVEEIRRKYQNQEVSKQVGKKQDVGGKWVGGYVGG